MSGSRNVENEAIIEVVALALLSADGRFMLARRGPAGSGAGEWEFPGGKIEAGETEEAALCREILEELQFDLGPYSKRKIAENLHRYPQKTVRIHLWAVELKGENPDFVLSDHDQVEWYRCAEMAALRMSPGDLSFVEVLNSYSRK